MKRHLNQTKKQKLGQFFTTNSNHILSGYENVVFGKDIIDPFAGGGDLLKWAKDNGAKSVIGYDIEPLDLNIIYNDSLCNPPDYCDFIVLTNPPWLSSNKCRTGNRTPYIKWKESDYYKCHLASLYDCEEAIEILPSNFFCESRDSIRKRMFKTHHIVSAKYWNQPSFDDATTGSCVVHLKRGARTEQRFELLLLPENRVIEMSLKPEYNYLHGEDFFKYIDGTQNIQPIKTDIGMEEPNTKIIVSWLEKGKYPMGLSFNDGETIWCKPSSLTTYQLTILNSSFSIDEQKSIISIFNEKLYYYKNKYDGMFLSNYMGPSQKILSRKYVNMLLNKTINSIRE